MEKLKEMIKNPKLVDPNSYLDGSRGFRESFVSYLIYSENLTHSDLNESERNEKVKSILQDLIDPDSFLERVPENSEELSLNLVHSKMIPDTISKFKQLKQLGLIIYALDGFPSAFKELDALEFLLIRSEIGTKLPPELLELKSLEQIALGGAALQHLYPDFQPDEQSRRVINELIDSDVRFMEYDM